MFSEYQGDVIQAATTGGGGEGFDLSGPLHTPDVLFSAAPPRRGGEGETQ